MFSHTHTILVLITIKYYCISVLLCFHTHTVLITIKYYCIYNVFTHTRIHTHWLVNILTSPLPIRRAGKSYKTCFPSIVPEQDVWACPLFLKFPWSPCITPYKIKTLNRFPSLPANLIIFRWKAIHMCIRDQVTYFTTFLSG